MRVLETDRLILRWLEPDDAPFILELLNQPSFLHFIGDRGVGTIEEARGYISQGPGQSYAEHGFGLYLVELKDDSTPIGMCGLLRRETLEDVDLGFALAKRLRLFSLFARRAERKMRNFHDNRLVAGKHTRCRASRVQDE